MERQCCNSDVITSDILKIATFEASGGGGLEKKIPAQNFLK